MATNCVFFHTGSPCHGCGGIGDTWRQLAAANVPFAVYSVEGAGLLVEASAYPTATLIFRMLATDVAPYDLTPADAAAAVWWQTMTALPPELKALKSRLWLEIGNEQDKTRADWLGRYYCELAALAGHDGYRLMGPGWATGEPEIRHWETGGWLDYLRLCSQYPDRLAVSVHEYSLDANDIMAGSPWLVGRIKLLYDVCDRQGIRRPTTFITELGWSHNDLPPAEKAKADIRAAAELYAQYPTVKAAFVWTLIGGGDKKTLAAELNALMPWLTEYTLTTDIPGGTPQPPPPPPPPKEEPMTNLLTNPSFEDGWTDATDFPGQHPNGWSIAWNTGAAADGYQYQIGEAVHKNAALLPEAERTVFIWNGQWSLKVFAANRAIWPRLKQTIANLPAGRYQLLTPVWTDCYHWRGYKDYGLDPRHIEWMVKVNGREVAPWRTLTAGSLQYPAAEFDHAGGAAELAVHLRANWPVASNNFWLDGWSLTAVTGNEPEPEPEPERHKAIVVKLPQDATAEEVRAMVAHAHSKRRTLTFSHDDLARLLTGGNPDSYAEILAPSRQPGVTAMVEGLGYRWVEVAPPFPG